MSAVVLLLMAHSTVQFLMPMPDMRTCLMNRAAAMDMFTKDKAVAAHARCFDTGHQAFYDPPEAPQAMARPEGEEKVE